MALPKHTELMLPVLELHADGEPHRGPELEDALTSRLNLGESDLQQTNKSGTRTIVNRIAWSQVDLSQAGLLSRPERGVTQITDRGRDVLAAPPEVIDRRYLQRFPEFRDFLQRRRGTSVDEEPTPPEGVTKEAVVSALEEASEIGRDAFLEEYGYGRAKSYVVVFKGEEFDSKAIYGVAYGYAHPDKGPLRNSDFSGGQFSVVRKLRALGFHVRGDEQEEPSGWDELLAIAARARVDPDFDKQERDYKLEIAEALREVIEVAKAGGEWLDELRRAWQQQYPSGPYNLTNWRQHEWLIGWARADARVESVIAGLGRTDKDLLEKFGDFSAAAEAAEAEGLAERSPGSVLAVGSVLVFAVEPDRAPLVRARVFEKCERAVNYESAPSRSIGDRYAHHLRFAEEARAKMEDAGIDIRDMLDVQSLLWIASHELGKTETEEEPESGSRLEPRVWWVNQGASFERSRAGGYAWAPKRTKDGSTRPDWDVLTRVRTGDTVLSYAQGAIRAVSEVRGDVFDAPRPDPEHDQAWEDDGRRLELQYADLADPIELNETPAVWRQEEGGPFDRNGGVKQGYMYELSDAFVARLADRFPQLGLPSGAPQERSLDRLAAQLYLPASFLADCIELLSRKGQLIFYGPPGTGKTYVARKLARFLTDEDEERLEIVQFHPSYSYEDFVEGYRPDVDSGGEMTYRLKSGPLLRLAEHASEAPHRRHVLLIDEINRGNLPRIFGELLFLLEYRNERVSLLYSGDESFELPDNLLVIGTMNTADRSIGLIDSALRRRFHFQALFPARPPIDEVLTKWLAGNAPSMAHVADDLDRLNARLRERFGEHVQVGHSYFMQLDLDDELLEQIWQADILPFLEEQLFGHEDELTDFSLEAIRVDDSDMRLTEEVREDDSADGVRDPIDGTDDDGA